MKKFTTVETKKGYVWIDTCSLVNPIGNMLDQMGAGNDDAIGHPYETMVFLSDKDGIVGDWKELEKANYDTEEEAELGHEKMVKKWKRK